MESEQKIALRAKLKAVSTLRLASLAGLGASLAALGWTGPEASPLAALGAAVCAGLAVKSWQARGLAQKQLRQIELGEARQELDEEIEQERQREERAQIANIAFEEPAGVFEGQTVYRVARRDGARFEFAGIATPSEEPSRELLIVNGLAYRLAP